MATTTFDKPVGSNQILTTDVADNLTTNDSTKVLSAKQGKILSGQIGALNSNIAQSVIGSSPIAIANGTDLNTITTPGYYVCAYNSSTETLSNCPISQGFTMQVIRGTVDGNVIQILISYYSGNTYKRVKHSTTWESWSSLYDQIGTLNSKFTSYVKYKQVDLTTEELGTAFSPTARRIGASSTLFGVNANKIISIITYGANLSPASNFTIGFDSGNVWIGATQSCTLTGTVKFTIGYVE